MKIRKVLLTSIAVLGMASLSIGASADATHDYDHMGVQRTPSEEQSVEEGTLKQDEMAEKWGDMSSSEVNAERNYIKQNMNNIHHGATSSINANDMKSSTQAGSDNGSSNKSSNGQIAGNHDNSDHNSDSTAGTKNKKSSKSSKPTKKSSKKPSTKKKHGKSVNINLDVPSKHKNHSHVGMWSAVVIIVIIVAGVLFKVFHKTTGKHSY